MFPEKPELSMSIPSKTELLKMVVDLAHHIATINQFPPSDARKIALAIDEAITNVIKHSYKGKMDEDIGLEFFCVPEGLKVKIKFTGVPPVLNKEKVDLPKMIKKGATGGLGVELMRRIMDSVTYETSDNINICEMVKWKKKKSAA